ncbi:MAG: PQQ-binding-like beta-propeller repeat protein [Acidimicrobiales bacterium]
MDHSSGSQEHGGRRVTRRRHQATGALAGLASGALLLSACGASPAGSPANGSGASGAKQAALTSKTASALPAASLQADFPQSWPMYAANGGHNAAFSAPASAKSLWKGYSWNFAEASAMPLGAPPKDQSVLGARGAPVKTTQFLGNSVGVSIVKGVVYSESDMGRLYAINAATGKMVWQARGNNAFMGNPLVEHGVVVAGSGDTGFSFSQLIKFVQHKPVVRGLGWASIYAFNATTGKKLWEVPTKGEDMPSLAYSHGMVFEGTGGGRVLALDLKTGRTAWATRVGGFDSMSSLAVNGSTVLVGFSNPNYVYCLDSATGKVLWRQTITGVANTGMGDNSPAVDSTRGIVLQNSIVDPNPKAGTINSEVFAMNAATGKLLWQTKLGRGPVPPAYKAGIAMVHNGVVYLGSPSTSTEYALSEQTGKVLWRFKIQGAGPAGAGRGGPTYYHGTLWLAAGPYIYAIDPANGKMLGKKLGGGRFGIVNPVIVGGTMYLGNSWGWTQAMPLSAIYPAWRSAP